MQVESDEHCVNVSVIHDIPPHFYCIRNVSIIDAGKIHFDFHFRLADHSPEDPIFTHDLLGLYPQHTLRCILIALVDIIIP